MEKLVPHWEHSPNRHGLWLGDAGDDVRLAFIGLTPPWFRPRTYRWSLDVCDRRRGEAPSLRAAKRAVRRALIECGCPTIPSQV